MFWFWDRWKIAEAKKGWSCERESSRRWEAGEGNWVFGFYLIWRLTPAGMIQSLYTSGLSGEISGSLDFSAVVIRKDSLMTAV